MQIIIVLETNNKEGSDFFYFKSILSRFYIERGTGVSIKQLYMNGKTNYEKLRNKIKNLKNRYDGESKVIYFCDVDCVELNYDQSKLNLQIIDYCKSNNYDLVWFNKNVEDVFLKHRITNDKTKIAKNYYINDYIYNLDENDLKSDAGRSGKSNVLLILDKYLGENKYFK